jgi:hypothetical protein
MKLKIIDLKTERQWRSNTGISKEKFYELLPEIGLTYTTVFGKSISERTSESPNSPSLTTYEDLLFFTLFSLKTGLTYDVLGFVSGMDGSNAKRNQSIGIELLNQTLFRLGHLPKRDFKDVEEFKTYFDSYKSITIDATENRIQRPKEKEEQKENYSGKKKHIQ